MELTGGGVGACSAEVAFMAPEGGNKGGRSAAGNTLGGGSNIRCDDVSMIAIIVLIPLPESRTHV